MTRLIIKYSILVVSSIVVARLLTVTILTIWPDLLTINISEGVSRKLGRGILETGISYLLNIIIIFLLSNDMKKENFKSVPILIMTFFSSLVGIIFFFLTIANNKLNSKQIDSHE
jgi:hypothetical protein